MDSALAHVLPSSAQDIGGELHIGGLCVKELASTYGTPLVVYDGDEITLRASAWVRAAHEHQIDTTFAFATKSCSLIGIIGRIRASSFGADVASEG
jgi:diaminopimelate decarboxylase